MQLTPPGKLRVPSASVVGNITVSGSYLQSAFIVQSGSSEKYDWIADSVASGYTTHDKTRLYNLRPLPARSRNSHDREPTEYQSVVYRKCNSPREDRPEDHVVGRCYVRFRFRI